MAGKGNENARPPARWRFGEFVLDAAERSLHHRGQPVTLRDKAFELLTLLLARAPRLIEQRDLRDALWPELSVHDNNLAVTVSTLRKALERHEPHSSFIETVPKRGYRWVHPLAATVDDALPSVARASAEGDDGERSAAALRTSAEPFVGRGAELHQLLRHWQASDAAAPPLVFVSGEAGIGKTMLLEHFGISVRRREPLLTVAVGHCLELSGATEPYLPWLEALNGILTGPHGEPWRRVIREHAPSWQALLPLGHGAAPASAPRARHSPLSVRELVDALITAAREHPLLLLLEDFHWADASSVDVLRALAARPRTRGLLAIVSYRSAEVRLGRSALSSLLEDLAARERRHELSLAGWGAAEVEDYLAARFGAHRRDARVARALWQRTEGLPFFATRLAQTLIESGALGPAHEADPGPLFEALDLRAAPSVAALIQGQLRRIPAAERRLLDAASVADADLSTTLLARVLRELPRAIEQGLDRLAVEHGVLERLGEHEPAPGVLSVRYRFRHVLLQQHVYQALDSHERRALHLGTARALLAAGAARAPDPSDASRPRPSRVAVHFDLGGNAENAVVFWTEAGDQAERALAPREGLSCYALAEQSLAQLPSGERELRRLFLRHGQGWAWFNLRALDRAEQCFVELGRLARWLERSEPRLRELAHEFFTRPWCDEIMRRPGDLLAPSSPARIPLELRAEALRCQCQVLMIDGRGPELRRRAQRLLRLGRAAQSPARIAEGQCFIALADMNSGHLERARRRLNRALSASRRGGHGRTLSVVLHALAELDLRRADLLSSRTLLLELLEKASSAADVAVASVRLGDTLARLGDVQGALSAHDRAAAIFERMEPPRPALVGWLLRELGRTEEARRVDEAALARARQLADTPLCSRLLASLGSTRCRVGLLEPAREAIDEGEALLGAERRRSAAWLHALWDARRELAIAQRDWPGLESIGRRWLSLARAQGHVEGQTAAHRGLARALLERGQLARARRHAEAAIALSKVRPLVLFDWRSHGLLAEIARRAGEEQLAERARAAAWRDVEAIADRLEPRHRAAWLSAASAAA